MIRILSIVTHLDTLLNYLKPSFYKFEKENKNFHVDLVKMKKANVKIAVFAIFVNPQLPAFDIINRTIELIDLFYSHIEKHSDILLIKDYQDINKVYSQNKIGIILAIEGGASIFNLSILRVLYKLGIRMLSLTWNCRNQLADGVSVIKNSKKISSLGKEVLDEMINMKMILDISHLSRYNFWEIFNNYKIPLLASHSNVSSLCNHQRNLDDKQIIAIKKSKGLIAINFYPPFLNKNNKVDINTVVEHIDYIKEIIGVEYIALGTDYDGIEKTPSGLEDISKISNLEYLLREKNYSNNEIKKIYHDNALNFFKNFWRE
ncbi:dipeptidase [Natronospora cellulosivora (SeqCode)]